MRQTAYFGVFMALSLIVSYVESLLPLQVGIPGVKLGLCNIVIVIALYRMGVRWAAGLSLLRVLAAGMLFGGVFSMAYSFAGAILSLFFMSLLKRVQGFSVAGVSLAGGLAHNVGQLLVAAFVVENLRILYYLPVLLIAGALTGLAVGLLARAVLTRLPAEFGRM